MLQDVLLRGGDEKELGDLIPEVYKKGLRYGLLTGVLTYDALMEPDRLVGVSLVRVTGEWQEIVWVALTQNYAIPEYGADIIWNREEAAREAGSLLGSFADIPADEKELVRYFELAGFALRRFEKDGEDYVRAFRAYEGSRTYDVWERISGGSRAEGGDGDV